MRDADAPLDTRRAARAQLEQRYDLPPGVEIAPQHGTDYLMARHTYLDPTLGLPCASLPLAEIMVIDIGAQSQTWRGPLGTVREVAMLPLKWGMPGMGGSLLTSEGLIFIGAASERALRAFDLDSGEELWQHDLPFPANATPMGYTVTTAEGDQPFVVVAAGGDARSGIGGEGDYLVAFSLGQ